MATKEPLLSQSASSTVGAPVPPKRPDGLMRGAARAPIGRSSDSNSSNSGGGNSNSSSNSGTTTNRSRVSSSANPRLSSGASSSDSDKHQFRSRPTFSSAVSSMARSMVSGPGTTSLPTRAKRNQLNLHTIQHGKNAAKKFAAHSRRNAQSRKRALPIPSRKNHHADSRKPLPPVTGAPALPMSSRPPLPQVHKKKYWPNYPHPPDPTRLRSVAKHVVNTSAFIKGASEGQKSESQRTPSINTTINAAASAAANTASGSTTESKRRQVATETAKINQLAKRRNRLQALAVRARANRQKALQSHKRKVLAMQRFQPLGK